MRSVAQVRQAWWGRSGVGMNETMELFYWQTVKPAIECEPGSGLKEQYLNQLVDFLSCDPNTSAKDVEMIKSICTGKMQRHPALHGVICLI